MVKRLDISTVAAFVFLAAVTRAKFVPPNFTATSGNGFTVMVADHFGHDTFTSRLDRGAFFSSHTGFSIRAAVLLASLIWSGTGVNLNIVNGMSDVVLDAT